MYTYIVISQKAVTAMRVAVIDDEQAERERIQAYLSRFAKESGSAIAVDAYASADALLSGYRPGYDILIFDIDMPGTNGMDAARIVREQDRDVTILFITNMAQYAINGYEVEAVDYIIKPIGYYDFAMKFRRAFSRAGRRRDKEVLLETVEGQCRVAVSGIVYVEAMGHYLVYHVAGEGGVVREVKVRGSIGEHGQMLRAYNFCQVHKSFLVNLEHIEEIRTGEVSVLGTAVPVGRAYKNQLLQEYMRFVRG